VSKRRGLTPQTSLVCRSFPTLQPDAPSLAECSHTTARVYFMSETDSTRVTPDRGEAAQGPQRITPCSLTSSNNTELEIDVSSERAQYVQVVLAV
jgi:hypothetical protein